MKKLIAMLLALTMLFSGMALAEAAQETATVTFDFGDFTMELDPEIQGELLERNENETFFTIYPAYTINGDEASNINGVWNSAVYDFTEYEDEEKGKAFAEELMNTVLSGYEEAGMKTENEQLLLASVFDQDGVAGFVIVYQADVDYSGIGYDLQVTLIQEQAYLSDAAFGTYIFTATAEDMDTLLNILTPALDTIRWKR